MSNALQLLLAAGAGTGIGLVNFAGLWHTLQRLPHAQRPAPWLLGSLVVRLAFVLTGLYLIGGDHWERILAALAGILVVRTVIVRCIRLPHAAAAQGGEGKRAP